ncbi:AAA family ATPase, partial [Sneathiella chinensis]|uniref:AAA family ATPase n=3 Tax=Sneathiella chinensis TaxID=349750 RepID=UPI0024E14645
VKKQIIPYFRPDGKPGIPSDLPGCNRLFGVETLSDQFAPVFIPEGEKCSAALHGLGYQAVTSLGGSNQVQLADWSILKGISEIYILPDTDEAGERYAQKVHEALRPLVGSVALYVLRFPLRDKADICDYLKSLPELADWNELDDLAAHPKRYEVRSHLNSYIEQNREPVPAHWKFIVTPNKHRLIAANDFRQLKLPERKLLLGPWLAEGSINMVFADRGIGKTFFCLSAAIAVANGGSFLSFEAPAPAPVLYLDGEMQATAMQERFRALSNGYDTKAPLHIYTPDIQDQDSGTPDIGLDTGRQAIDQLIALVDPRVVFIDNISTFVRTGNENEGDSWAPVQEWAVQLRKRGIAIVFVHHANKEGKQRGSHKKEDVMDIVIQLKRPDDYLAGEDATRMLVRYTKARHLEAKDTRDMEATLRNEDGTLVWTYEAGDPTYVRCVELLKENIPYGEIADTLNVSKSSITRMKQKAQAEGLL